LILAYYVGRVNGRDAAYQDLRKYIPDEVIEESMDYMEMREIMDGQNDSFDGPF
jgi:hypothetical protein